MHGLERNLPVVLQGKMQDSHVVQQEVWENVEPCLKKDKMLSSVSDVEQSG